MSKQANRMGVGAAALAGLTFLCAQAAPAADKPLSVSVLKAYTNCDAEGKPINPKLTIAFAQTDLNTPWRVAELKHFQFWAKKLCVPNFIWNQANEDVSKELSNVADLLAQKPDVLLLDPEASKPLVPAAEMARKANVPMIDIDRKIDLDPGPDTYLALINADNFAVGYNSAAAWVASLKKRQNTDSPKGNVAILAGGVGQDPAIDRNKGVEAAVKDYPGIKIVANQSGDWTREGGRKVMEAYIQRFSSGELEGVFAASDEMMIGARQALDAAKRTDLDGKFFTGDGQLEGLEAVVSGFDVADTQFPPLYGEASLQAAIAVSQGKTLPSRYFSLDLQTFTCLTKEDCDKTKAYVAQLNLSGMKF